MNLIGKMLNNRYEVLEKIGNGGMATVYKAKCHVLNRYVAIKILKDEFTTDSEFIKKFNSEAQSAASLAHPNIVQIYDVCNEDNLYYIVMELIQGKTLKEIITEDGILSWKWSVNIAIQIASALETAHKNNIVHRDIKPENIGITDSMHLKFFDFGTAYIIDKYFDKKKNRFVEIDKEIFNEILKENYEEEEIEIGNYLIQNLICEFVGTAEYVSPEVLLHKYNEIDTSVDLWAFGCIIYLLFEGKTPFKEKNENDIFENIKNLNYTFDNNIPEDAKDLVKKLLVLNPKERIGYGDENNNYKDIRNHPFFKDIDFDNLDITDPPIERIEMTLREYGFFNENIEENDLNLSDNQNNNYNLNDDSSDSDFSNEFKSKIKRIKSMNKLGLAKLNKKMEEEENILENNNNINNEDQVLIQDMLKKKSPWFHYNIRFVKLYAKGIIEYYESDKKTLKGTIVINEFCSVEVHNDYKFEIITEKRKYVFKHTINKIAHLWADKINSIIFKKLKQNKE
jgi:serine/threonine-protein kinase